MGTLPASGADTERDEIHLPIAVPDATAIARLLREILPPHVTVVRVDHAPPKLDRDHVLACYADGAEELRALVLVDLRLSLAIGDAFSETPAAPPAVATPEAPSSEAFHSIHGAFSTFSVLFDSGAAGQVKLVGLNRADELAAAGIMRLLESAWARATYAVDVADFAKGTLSVFTGGANRRGGLRVRHRARVEIHFEGHAGVRETCDLSSGGLYVSDPDPPRVGALGEITLSLEGVPHLLQFPARVAWRSVLATAGGLPPGFGLQLLMAPGPDHDRFQVAVLRLARAASGAAPLPSAPRLKASPVHPDHRLGPILVVDQTKFVRTQVANCLAQAGYTTVVAADGVEALETMRRTEIAMVVCEVNMPRMSGIELLEMMPRSSGRPLVPVILLTNDTEPLLVRRAKSLGAQAWLMKPVQPQVLLSAVKKFLTEHEAPAAG